VSPNFTKEEEPRLAARLARRRPARGEAVELAFAALGQDRGEAIEPVGRIRHEADARGEGQILAGRHQFGDIPMPAAILDIDRLAIDDFPIEDTAMADEGDAGLFGSGRFGLRGKCGGSDGREQGKGETPFHGGGVAGGR